MYRRSPPKPRRIPISIHVHIGPKAALKCRENNTRVQFLIRTTTKKTAFLEGLIEFDTVCVCVVADSARHFQQIGHQPGVVANPARGQLNYAQLLAVFVC